MFDNVQFIYELSLAELELKSLGVEYSICSNELREFSVTNYSPKFKETIIKRVAYFKTIDNDFTHYYNIQEKNRTNSVNQYLTHWIYPYKGKFHPQMIRALLNIIGVQQGDIVLDPFSGSGTTALECQLLGINFFGVDISPLCVIQGRVKTESIYVLDEIVELKDEIISNIEPNLFQKTENYYEFISRITDSEKVSNFYILARLVAVSDNSRRKRDFTTSFKRNLELMISSIKDYHLLKKELNLTLGKTKIEIGDARKLNLKDNSVDGIITSPPYSIALDYVQNDEHALKDLGYETRKLKDKFIGVRGDGKSRLFLYNEDMLSSYTEMHRVLKPNKFAVIIIGNATYQAKEINTVDFTIDVMKKLGFKLTLNINKIIFGLYNVMKKENVLIFKKA
ncbi:MAG: DNA methyltransferase [Ignavibacteria bacterium]|nr:DNA methyltransferase [Ignavibacteria bacterium]